MIETPVSVSPCIRAWAMGDAPRHRGKSEACTLSMPLKETKVIVILGFSGNRLSQTGLTEGRTKWVFSGSVYRMKPRCPNQRIEAQSAVAIDYARLNLLEWKILGLWAPNVSWEGCIPPNGTRHFRALIWKHVKVFHWSCFDGDWVSHVLTDVAVKLLMFAPQIDPCQKIALEMKAWLGNCDTTVDRTRLSIWVGSFWIAMQAFPLPFP